MRSTLTLLVVLVALVALFGVTGCDVPFTPRWAGGEYGFTVENQTEWSLVLEVKNTDGWYSGTNRPYVPAGGGVFIPLPGQGEFPVWAYRPGTTDGGFKTFVRFTVRVADGAPNPTVILGRDRQVYTH